MKNNDFEKLCKKLLIEFYNDAYDILLHDEDVYIVWSCKTLQNNKALLATNNPDHLYYELTYNGDKKEVYLDEYKKQFNHAYSVDEISKEISYKCLADDNYGIYINFGKRDENEQIRKNDEC